MRLFLVAVVLAAAIVPATLSLPEAEACQPVWWKCPLNGRMYASCGTTLPTSSPLARCVNDVLREATLP